VPIRKFRLSISRCSEPKNLGFQLSEVNPGVDSIIDMQILEQPNFDHPEELMQVIETKVLEFAESIKVLVHP